jgi:hypothetical protein
MASTLPPPRWPGGKLRAARLRANRVRGQARSFGTGQLGPWSWRELRCSVWMSEMVNSRSSPGLEADFVQTSVSVRLLVGAKETRRATRRIALTPWQRSETVSDSDDRFDVQVCVYS